MVPLLIPRLVCERSAEPAPLDERHVDEQRIGEGNEADYAARYFNFRKASIYGGSNEIQKNIVSKHVLGL